MMYVLVLKLYFLSFLNGFFRATLPSHSTETHELIILIPFRAKLYKSAVKLLKKHGERKTPSLL